MPYGKGPKRLLYLDDIIIFGDTFQETLDNLIRFREYNLSSKLRNAPYSGGK